ncbi:Protein LURP-one-related 15 [Cardamine amara subsp. amara]|uniref:Protein LURP-one-related 15 n=1 Tax=Cardamine amara subsp. amara TaxID=228776 RepID=A0ABD0ZBC7_CARAN
MEQPQQGSGVTGVLVDPRFCASYPVELAIVRKVMRLTAGNFVIKDVNGKMLFKVKDRVFGVHDKRTLLDSSGSKVLTLREKIMSMHSRWQVFRGGSTEQRDLLYTVKKTSMIQFKTKLDVFLSHNEEEERCDFRVKGNWSESSCVVYAGESDAIVAQMDKEDNFWGKDNYTVTVNPNVDYAFIASLIVILDDVNRPISLPILDIGTSLLLN